MTDDLPEPQQPYGVPDEENPEWTAEEIRTAKPFGEVFPDRERPTIVLAFKMDRD